MATRRTRCGRCAAICGELCAFLAQQGLDARDAAAASRCAAGRRSSRRAASRPPRSRAGSRRRARCSAISCAAASAPTIRRSCSSGPRRRRRLPEPVTAADCATLLDGTLERRRAQPARSRDPRAAVRLRPARERGLRPRRSRPTTPPPARLRVIGKGDRERIVPVGEPARDALDDWLRDGRPRVATRVRRAARERARPPALAVGRAAGRSSAALASPASARARRTRSGTPTLHICWRGARACARSRSCSATRPPRPLRSTRTLPSRISCASTPTTTPEADGCRNHRDDRARPPRRAR